MHPEIHWQTSSRANNLLFHFLKCPHTKYTSERNHTTCRSNLFIFHLECSSKRSVCKLVPCALFWLVCIEPTSKQEKTPVERCTCWSRLDLFRWDVHDIIGPPSFACMVPKLLQTCEIYTPAKKLTKKFTSEVT